MSDYRIIVGSDPQGGWGCSNELLNDFGWQLDRPNPLPSVSNVVFPLNEYIESVWRVRYWQVFGSDYGGAKRFNGEMMPSWRSAFYVMESGSTKNTPISPVGFAALPRNEIEMLYNREFGVTAHAAFNAQGMFGIDNFLGQIAFRYDFGNAFLDDDRGRVRVPVHFDISDSANSRVVTSDFSYLKNAGAQFQDSLFARGGSSGDASISFHGSQVVRTYHFAAEAVAEDDWFFTGQWNYNIFPLEFWEWRRNETSPPKWDKVTGAPNPELPYWK